MTGFRGLPLFLLAACTTPADRDERVAADRHDVTHALYRQFDKVLAQRDALAKEPGDEAARTRGELNDLAHDIAERIVRLDPDADVDALVQRLKEPQ